MAGEKRTLLSGPPSVEDEHIEPESVGGSDGEPVVLTSDVDADGFDVLNAGNMATKAELAEKADLTDQDELYPSQLPDLAITEVYTVADEDERLSLSVEEGDVAIQQDTDESYMFAGGDSSDSSNWSVLQNPPPPITSVFGRTGDVEAQDGDYTAEQVGAVDADNFGISAILEGTESDKPQAGTEGQFYWATDTNILYRDDGSTWNAKAGRGTSSNPLPGTTHRESMSIGEVIRGDQGYREDYLGKTVVTLTGSTTESVSLSGDYNSYVLKMNMERMNNNYISLRFNGLSDSNYWDFNVATNTTQTGVSEAQIGSVRGAASQVVSGEIEIGNRNPGISSGQPKYRAEFTTYRDRGEDSTWTGGYNGEIAPLDSVDFLAPAGSGDVAKLTIHQFGINK